PGVRRRSQNGQHAPSRRESPRLRARISEGACAPAWFLAVAGSRLSPVVGNRVGFSERPQAGNKTPLQPVEDRRRVPVQPPANRRRCDFDLAVTSQPVGEPIAIPSDGNAVCQTRQGFFRNSPRPLEIEKTLFQSLIHLKTQTKE